MIDDVTRLRREAFVSGHHGTSIWEIQTVCSILPVSLLLRAFVTRWTYPIQSRSWKSTSAILADIIIVGLPLLIGSTLPEFALPIIAFQSYIMLFLIVLAPLQLDRQREEIPRIRREDKHPQDEVEAPVTTSPLARIGAISRLRAGMLLLTAISILGVDFPLYPRRFAKTEEYGTGLMDVGVGAFVLCASLVHPLSRSAPTLSSNISSSHVAAPPPSSSPRRCTEMLRSSALLLVLGFVRAALNWSVNYQQHTSEYGVHWNFFLTLACVNLALNLAHRLLILFLILKHHRHHRQHHRLHNNRDTNTNCNSLEKCQEEVYSNAPAGFRLPVVVLAVGGLLLLLHQSVLSLGGLSFWALHAPRVDLLTANKEGVASLLGFIVLAFMSAGIGGCVHVFLARVPTKESASQLRQQQERRRFYQALLVCLVVFDAILWYLGDVVSRRVEAPSRRLCNAAYVLWILALGTSLLVGCLLPDALDIQGLLGRREGMMMKVAGLRGVGDTMTVTLENKRERNQQDQEEEEEEGQEEGQEDELQPPRRRKKCGFAQVLSTVLHPPTNSNSGINGNSKSGSASALLHQPPTFVQKRTVSSLGVDDDGDVGALVSHVNKHSLTFFVLSNLLTGLVNLTVDTLVVTDLIAFCILFIYLVLSILAAGLVPLFMSGIRSRCCSRQEERGELRTI